MQKRIFFYGLTIILGLMITPGMIMAETAGPYTGPVSDTDQLDATTDSAKLVEKLGHYIDLDARFVDSNGAPVLLRDYIDRPTLVLMVFFHCARACGLQTAYLATALKQIDDKPGVDYKVLNISFDDEDIPEYAQNMKSNYLNLTRADFPTDQWLYLTGTSKNINKVTTSLGYGFKKIEQHSFIHPNVLVMVARDGKITRYLQGPNFQPFDVSMAIAEAKQGILGISVKKALSYCFDYDPLKKRYVFSLFRVTGVATVIVLLLFYFLFLRRGKTPVKRNRF